MNRTLKPFTMLCRDRKSAESIAELHGFTVNQDGTITRDWFGTNQNATVAREGDAWRLTHP